MANMDDKTNAALENVVDEKTFIEFLRCYMGGKTAALKCF